MRFYSFEGTTGGSVGESEIRFQPFLRFYFSPRGANYSVAIFVSPVSTLLEILPDYLDPRQPLQDYDAVSTLLEILLVKLMFYNDVLGYVVSTLLEILRAASILDAPELSTSFQPFLRFYEEETGNYEEA